MSELNSVVAVYKSHEEAEQAVRELKRSGFDIKKVSIVGKGLQSEEQISGFYNTGERIKAWGTFGAFWGALWGLLIGAAFFAVPGIGPVAVAGPLVAAIVTALEGAVFVGGLSAIGAALVGMGIPKDSVLQYEIALKASKFLLVVHSTADEVARARDILKNTHPEELDVHVAEPAHA
jgi:uncharacterized membrane protein